MSAQLEHYLGALWGGRFSVSFGDGSLERATFDGRSQLLPPARPGDDRLARARAAHAGAHAAFSGPRFAEGELKPVTQVLVSLFEDARVEALALRRFPGLFRLWAPFHVSDAASATSAFGRLARLARALFDPRYLDPDSWIQKAQRAFLALDLERASADESRRLGNLLGNDWGQMRVRFDARSYVVEPIYRDDHSGLWDRPPSPAKLVSGGEPTSERETLAPKLVGTLHAYPEWDYVIARARPGFCELYDAPAEASREAKPSAVPPALVARARRGLRRALLRTVWQRRQTDGPHFDLSALVDAAAERAKIGSSPLRVYQRPRRRPTRTSALLLLDLSQSSRLTLADGSRALELGRIGARLLCAARLPGLELAIDGFSSDGRKQVRYTRVKDFTEASSGAAERLAALEAGGSTRLGAALRHASARLAQRPRAEKLLWVVTDADPADVDAYDPNYLIEDARAAVAEAERAGVRVLAWCLPGAASAPGARVFGPARVKLERLDHLPGCLRGAGARGRGRAA